MQIIVINAYKYQNFRNLTALTINSLFLKIYIYEWCLPSCKYKEKQIMSLKNIKYNFLISYNENKTL